MSRRFFLVGTIILWSWTAAYGAPEKPHPVQSGYFWASVPYQDNGADPKPSAAVVAFSEGTVTKEGKDGMIVWAGAAGSPGQVDLVFDLTKDHLLDRIEIEARPLYDCYGIKDVVVSYRSEAMDDYLPAGMQVWTKDRPLVFTMGRKKVRCVKIRLNRLHEYQFMPLNRVLFLAVDPAGDPLPAAAPTEKQMQSELARRTLLVDRYGQYLGETWPGKISDDKQLQADADREAKALENVKPDPKQFDRYGGWRQGPPFKATGFFRLEKSKGRWWFVTPEGNRFFLVGVDDVYNQTWGTSTPLARNAFLELPDRKAFPEAYATVGGTETVNFLTANLKRKYGPDFDNRWVAVMQKRLLEWGFNGNGKWARHPRLPIPYIYVLNPAGARRIAVRFEGGYAPCDPFDAGFAKAVEQGVQKDLDNLKNDPWLIGHTFENESGWNANVVKEIALRTDGLAAKDALIRFLETRAAGNLAVVNRQFGTQAKTWKDLAACPLDADKLAQGDAVAFIRLASQTYYRQVRAVLRRYDPNHLFLGSSLTVGWHSSTDWDTGGAEFLDAISLDYYSGDPSWIKEYRSAGKPILLLEFSFSAAGRGLSALTGFVPSQRHRGLCYRYYIEHLAADPLMVSLGWFLCYDAPVTGRPDGENFNMGLMNACDQPYGDMIAEMKKTNRRIYDLHAGKIPPVSPAELGM